MTPKQNQWSWCFTLSFVALIATSTFGQGWGWIIGWVMFGGFSLVKLACHGGLDVVDDETINGEDWEAYHDDEY